MLAKYQVPAKPRVSSNWTKNHLVRFKKAAWFVLKYLFLVATVTDGDGLTPAFHATKTVSKCHRVVWKNSQFCHHKEAYKESQPLILHQATERSEHTRTFKTHQTEYQALGTLQSPDHHWNTFSAGDPVALCAKRSTDTSGVMILIHTAAIHVKVCASYCGYSSASGPRGRAPPPPAAPTVCGLSGTKKLWGCLVLPLAQSWPCLGMHNGGTAMWEQGGSKDTEMERTCSAETVTLCGSRPLLGTRLIHLGGQIFIQLCANSLTPVDKRGERKEKLFMEVLHGCRWAATIMFCIFQFALCFGCNVLQMIVLVDSDAFSFI